MKSISKDTAEHYVWGDGCDGWHLLANDELSVIEESVPAGCSETRHFHEYAQQFFYVLSGCVVIEVNGEEQGLDPGKGIHIPPGVAHQLINRSEETARFLVISNPKSHGDRVDA